MSELPLSRTAMQEQLAYLRARVQRVNEKYADRPAPVEDPEFSTRLPRPAARYIEEWLTGAEVETDYGRHFETEKLWEPHQHHGSADIGALADLPHDLLETISGGLCPNASPEEWAFLDTETTGLAGGSGTCAFLVGVGRVTREGFYVKQFFMRDHAEEASQLDALSRHLASFKVLITYNGRTFDQPLLETRYRLNRARPPFARMEHLDLLHGARRLWKLRFESCRLVDLENQILGIEREGDVPGALIPYLYFEYLRAHHRESPNSRPVGRIAVSPAFYPDFTRPNFLLGSYSPTTTAAAQVNRPEARPAHQVIDKVGGDKIDPARSEAQVVVRTVILLSMSALLLAPLFVSPPAFSQATGGSISGSVTDPSGGVVPGVTVTAINLDTTVQQTTSTNADGFYAFPNLAVGRYEIQVQLAGFQSFRRTGLVLDIGTQLRSDVTLAVNTQSTQVVVTAQAAEVQPDTQQTLMGETLPLVQVESVPLNGRAFTDILNIQAGVIPVTTQSSANVIMAGVTSAPPSGNLNPGNVSVNGQPESANGFVVNGADVEEDVNLGTAVIPNLESIDEFRILTNNFDAKYGNFSGGLVVVSTKSGNNVIHGDVFDFVRNTALDAKNFFNVSTPRLRPTAVRRHRWGKDQAKQSLLVR